MSEQMEAQPVVRGCGSRKKGGVYWEVGFSVHGKPIEAFFRCPPPTIDVKKLGIKYQGIKIWEVTEGEYSAIDWISSGDYPNVADFLEEGRRFGVSRRLELTADQYKLLDPLKSSLICVHTCGWINDPKNHWKDRYGMKDPFFGDRFSWKYCPKDVPEHDLASPYVKDPPMCCGLWWEDVVDAVPVVGGARLAYRTMPSFRYKCVATPKSMKNYTPAVIAVFPLGRIVVVEDPDEGKHEKKLDIIRDAGLPVELVKE